MCWNVDWQYSYFSRVVPLPYFPLKPWDRTARCCLHSSHTIFWSEVNFITVKVSTLVHLVLWKHDSQICALGQLPKIQQFDFHTKISVLCMECCLWDYFPVNAILYDIESLPSVLSCIETTGEQVNFYVTALIVKIIQVVGGTVESNQLEGW